MIKVLGTALIFGALAVASTMLTGDHICHRQEK